MQSGESLATIQARPQVMGVHFMRDVIACTDVELLENRPQVR